MERVLCIVGGMNAGGAETFLMKILRKIDKERYTMDFCVFTNQKGYYDDEILSLGSKIYHVVPKTKSPIQSISSIVDIVKSNRYRSVLRISQNSISSLDLLAAKIGGAEKLIFRSSNSNTCGTIFEDIMHFAFRPLVKFVANIKIAPSNEAALFMFGNSALKKGSVIKLHNGLDVYNYRFSEIARELRRNEFNFKNKLVIGHIGRFTKQKNHNFLIDVFCEIKKIEKNSVLLLVGDGELRRLIEDKVRALGLLNDVIFTGIRNDIPELLSAMDIFLFPSLFEGLPNTVIEAQTSGLPCIVSDSITKEVCITNIIEMYSLNKSPSYWAKRVLDVKKVNCNDRKEYSNKVRLEGYDIEDVIDKFIKLVFK